MDDFPKNFSPGRNEWRGKVTIGSNLAPEPSRLLYLPVYFPNANLHKAVSLEKWFEQTWRDKKLVWEWERRDGDWNLAVAKSNCPSHMVFWDVESTVVRGQIYLSSFLWCPFRCTCLDSAFSENATSETHNIRKCCWKGTGQSLKQCSKPTWACVVSATVKYMSNSQSRV